jgi:hypothetical protein
LKLMDHRLRAVAVTKRTQSRRPDIAVKRKKIKFSQTHLYSRPQACPKPNRESLRHRERNQNRCVFQPATIERGSVQPGEPRPGGSMSLSAGYLCKDQHFCDRWITQGLEVLMNVYVDSTVTSGKPQYIPAQSALSSAASSIA